MVTLLYLLMTCFYSFTAVYFRWKLKIKQVCTWAVDERVQYENSIQTTKSEKRHKKLWKWHATTREKLLRTWFQYNYHPKWRKFISKQRINTNQYLFLFALDIKRTYDYYETGKWHEHNIRISTPGEGLTMRQSFLQISVTPEWQ